MCTHREYELLRTYGVEYLPILVHGHSPTEAVVNDLHGLVCRTRQLKIGTVSHIIFHLISGHGYYYNREHAGTP
jgi:hypothetical protein